jgi:hypothetical protein
MFFSHSSITRGTPDGEYDLRFGADEENVRELMIGTWSGGDPNSFVHITGTSLTVAEPIVGAAFSCTSPVSAGSFTIPSAVLLSLPPSGTLSLPSSGAFVGSRPAER